MRTGSTQLDKLALHMCDEFFLVKSSRIQQSFWNIAAEGRSFKQAPVGIQMTFRTWREHVNSLAGNFHASDCSDQFLKIEALCETKLGCKDPQDNDVLACTV